MVFTKLKVTFACTAFTLIMVFAHCADIEYTKLGIGFLFWSILSVLYTYKLSVCIVEQLLRARTIQHGVVYEAKIVDYENGIGCNFGGKYPLTLIVSIQDGLGSTVAVPTEGYDEFYYPIDSECTVAVYDNYVALVNKRSASFLKAFLLTLKEELFK